jgi:hypothetical protein
MHGDSPLSGKGPTNAVALPSNKPNRYLLTAVAIPCTCGLAKQVRATIAGSVTQSSKGDINYMLHRALPWPHSHVVCYAIQIRDGTKGMPRKGDIHVMHASPSCKQLSRSNRFTSGVPEADIECVGRAAAGRHAEQHNAACYAMSCYALIFYVMSACVLLISSCSYALLDWATWDRCDTAEARAEPMGRGGFLSCSV